MARLPGTLRDRCSLRRAQLLWIALLLCVIACRDPRRELQTVVKVRGEAVVVRYEDGRLLEVLNDMGYELVEDQQVKVVENCDGRLHVVVAYATP